MLENAHMNMMKAAKLSEEAVIEAVKTANDDSIKVGITSLHDSGGYSYLQMRAMQKEVEKKLIKVRINSILFSFVDNIGFVKDYIKTGIYTNFGNDKLKLGPVKIMVDGSRVLVQKKILSPKYIEKLYPIV